MGQSSSVPDTMRVRPHHVPRWALNDIADLLQIAAVDDAVTVTGLSLNTSAVRPGDLYIAVPGSRAHGADFVDRARHAGALAVLTDESGAQTVAGRLPALVHPRPRDVLPELAARFYGYPARDLITVGITGTQGKTTASYLAEAALGDSRCSVIGTIGTRINGIAAATELTTPEAPALQGLFAVMREEHSATCAMEVSSHALVQGRVDGIVFDVAVFLNLGRDHLDYHHSMEEYFLAKARLFSAGHARAAVINIDDEYGRRLSGMTSLPVTTFSLHDHTADWYAGDITAEPGGSRADVRGPDGLRMTLDVPLPGVFNIANAVAVLASLSRAGHDPYELAAGIARAPQIPGRLERIERGQPFAAFVDYAHKPDAVKAVLAALRPLTDGRLIIVLGAGGERDHGKRPLMGLAAADYADVVVVTDDNPRHEDPAAIRHAVMSQIADSAVRVVEVPGRRDAIEYAVGLAENADAVVIAGKGHETGQQIGDEVLPFDDRVVLADAIGTHV